MCGKYVRLVALPANRRYFLGKADFAPIDRARTALRIGVCA